MYDVTELLQEGENVAGVLLGNGFYNVQGGRYRKLQDQLRGTDSFIPHCLSIMKMEHGMWFALTTVEI